MKHLSNLFVYFDNPSGGISRAGVGNQIPTRTYCGVLLLTAKPWDVCLPGRLPAHCRHLQPSASKPEVWLGEHRGPPNRFVKGTAAKLIWSSGSRLREGFPDFSHVTSDGQLQRRPEVGLVHPNRSTCSLFLLSTRSAPELHAPPAHHSPGPRIVLQLGPLHSHVLLLFLGLFPSVFS